MKKYIVYLVCMATVGMCILLYGAACEYSSDFECSVTCEYDTAPECAAMNFDPVGVGPEYAVVPDMRIMTFNVRRDGKESDQKYVWQRRIPLIQAMLQDTCPDIIGLQEAGPNQIVDIAKILGSNYAWVGEGRQQGGVAGWFCSVDEHTPIFYSRARFQLLESDTFWLNPRKIPKTSGWGAWLNRICTRAKLVDISSGLVTWIFNTHLDHMSLQARTEGLKLIIREIKKITAQDQSVFLMGDFNDSLEIGSLADIIASDRYQMLNTKIIAQHIGGSADTAFQHGWEGEGKCIDHILMNRPNNFIVDEHVTWKHPENKSISDHSPVFITVRAGLAEGNIL